MCTVHSTSHGGVGSWAAVVTSQKLPLVTSSSFFQGPLSGYRGSIFSVAFLASERMSGLLGVLLFPPLRAMNLIIWGLMCDLFMSGNDSSKPWVFFLVVSVSVT